METHYWVGYACYFVTGVLWGALWTHIIMKHLWNKRHKGEG